MFATLHCNIDSFAESQLGYVGSFAALQYRQCSFAVTTQFASLQLRRFAFLQFCSLAVLQFCSFAAFELFALFTVFASFAWFTVSLLCSISQE